MNNDLISRSALLEEIKRIGGQPFSEWETAGVVSMVNAIPAVNAETYLEQLELVKEALEMAKQSLAPVVRCKDCKRRGDPDKCPMCYEVPVYQCNGEDSDGELCWDVWEEIEDRTIDDSFCNCGERRGDDA